MISSKSFVAGRIYSVVYSAPVEMVEKRELSAEQNAELNTTSLTACHFGKDGTPSGKTLNLLAERKVSVRRVSSVTAAGGQTWENFKAKNGLESGESTRKSWYQETENNCIVEGVSANTIGRKYLRGLPQGVTKEEYFIDDKEATSEEVFVIKAFRKGGTSQADFVLLSLDKLENVIDNTIE